MSETASSSDMPVFCARRGALQDKVPSTKLPGLIEVLRQDPRRAGSKYEPNRVYHLAYAGLDISFTVDGTQLTVTDVDDAQG